MSRYSHTTQLIVGSQPRETKVSSNQNDRKQASHENTGSRFEQFSKEAIMKTNRYMVDGISCVIMEKEIQTVARSCPIPVRRVYIKKTPNKKWWRWCGEDESLYISGENVSWCDPWIAAWIYVKGKRERLSSLISGVPESLLGTSYL